MEKKTLVIDFLQKVLAGKLKENVNLEHIAESLISVTDFNRTYDEVEGKRVTEIIDKAKNSVELFKKQMEDELSSTGDDEKLLKNFIKGRIESYEEILGEVINKL